MAERGDHVLEEDPVGVSAAVATERMGVMHLEEPPWQQDDKRRPEWLHKRSWQVGDELL